MLNLTGVENHKKTIVTIEFITLTLYWVWDFIKTDTFAILSPKLPKTWPNRWQLPTLIGVNTDRRQKLQKTIVTTDFTALDLCRVQNFIKIEAFTAFHPKLWPERWHVPTLASVKNYKKSLSSINSAPSNCSLCKISWKMVNLIPRSLFSFLKISYFKLRYCWEETRISNIRNKSS